MFSAAQGRRKLGFTTENIAFLAVFGLISVVFGRRKLLAEN
jgi:hypothetical protein